MAENGHGLTFYFIILMALMVLTLATVGAAYIHVSAFWHNFIALAIAAVKATLVIAYFMHVKGSTALVKLSAIGGFFWMAIFFIFILADILTRTTLVSGWITGG